VTGPATITARGLATVPGTPDEAVVAVDLSALKPSSAEAYTEVAERSARFEELRASLGIPDERTWTQGVSVREEREHDGTAWRHRGFLAAMRVLVRLEDPELVARLLREAVERVEAAVEGPWWQVAQTNPVRAEACRLAAAEARRKAEAYAEALGVRLGAVVEVREPAGGWSEYPGPTTPWGPVAAAGGPPEIPVHASELAVSAAVDVTFAIGQP
jgi:uncharacterized protein YggE